MRYLALTLLLGGCVTKGDLNSLREEIRSTSKGVDQNTYHIRTEACKTNAMLCTLGQVATQEVCLEGYAACLAESLEEYRSTHGEDPRKLFEPKRAR